MKLFQSSTAADGNAKPAQKLQEKHTVFKYIHPNVIRPHVTEKTTAAKDWGNAYGFIVRSNATKPSIKSEIEKMYKVNVTHINVARMPRKARRLGKSHGYVSGYKKALVYLKKGDTISFA
ncbi:MAG: 50S ribosomal protein L23 [Candidatus Brennerbacteria bacterium CG11_big_fil_rev_8_21_14_0_20_43_10]|uniref:Large ribosomal subunit protein uL23 n=3 Tax=Candidatus Brenneribacteriota TaxID=1817902 RepID=A0A2M8C346_9BACT|nr:MAG: 50S ribosomal protein L23 [Candidatus Brennerbacteria bacterium CG23_combo_of_CG06-09_8_20_14_all_44_41]PIR26156.1 MAG: 50S ribosomal protein L23 [Candidatus Brennerbacteria bacterium CG11_big_fil_rev_8_21_14_0_20_43_10]PIX28759.1 MAG: 50S ribosomal protein L23 [Candidatus Brennerbacteria bacterium CG_4_8_14_3_um_filter_43_14]PJA19857.1 MAG: 50S ribosomal protein L23 [Candidatus Brennerbacteria bacterium CG_4_10_14_0_2_um_filter_43_14]PJB50515.1 MAG: 50S ribosomal protein L23 [Candidatu